VLRASGAVRARLTARLLLAVSLVVAATACSQPSPKPAPLSTTPATPTAPATSATTPSPTATPTTAPTGKEPSAADQRAAALALETMFNATNTAIDLRSVDGLKGTYDASCSWCLLEFGLIDEAGFVGYQLSGGRISKKVIVSDRVASNGWLVFDVHLTSADLVATKSGKVQRRVKGGRNVGYEFALRSANEKWVVVAGQRGTLKF
jgi:hypothetical protein